MSTLFLVRHANTFEPYQAPHWVGAQEDYPLSSSGLSQLPALRSRISSRLGGVTPCVISSPLKRARSTADIFGVPVQIDSRLKELDYGDWAGKTDAEICAIGGAAAALEKWRASSIVPKTWNVDVNQINAELESFLTECSERALTVAVTSNGILKLIGTTLFGAGSWSVKTAHFCELRHEAKCWVSVCWSA